MLNKTFKLILLIGLCMLTGQLFAQEHGETEPYIAPTDPLVQQNLEKWQDLKFGLMMHWGPYSQWGEVESWSICNETWIRRPEGSSYDEYKKQYEALQYSFNPVAFDPEKWADAAKDAGMKYMVFTTKHHDGFSMYDTKLTDYKITDEKTAFHVNPKADVTKYIFEAFRDQDFMIGAYFSKPDWHNEDYWWPYYATPDRNVNYDTEKHADKWQNFVDFTHGQVREILTNYGDVDILWFDGGWVRNYPEEMLKKRGPNFHNQDIKMDEMAEMARSLQPGIIVVDRAVHGPNENYRTPEQHIPGELLDYPWETCMTMGNSWSWVPNDTYKTTETIIFNLVDIVSKGGNYLLNIGPGPHGDYSPVAYERLKEIGQWMDANGQSIYGTRAIPVKTEKNTFLTQKGNKLFVFVYNAEGEEVNRTITIPEIPNHTISTKGKAVVSRKSVRLKKEDGKYIFKQSKSFLPKSANFNMTVYSFDLK